MVVENIFKTSRDNLSPANPQKVQNVLETTPKTISKKYIYTFKVHGSNFKGPATVT